MATDTASLMVESVFLAKLIASNLYGDPVEGLRDRLIERAPNGLTEECLLAAAEIILRSHGSGAFPKLPACIRAIEDTFRAPVSISKAASIGHIDATNYAEAAIKYARSRYQKELIPVIDKELEPQKWEAWLAYFRMIDMKATTSLMSFSAKRWTVPAPWPWEFDGSAAQLGITKQERTAA